MEKERRAAVFALAVIALLTLNGCQKDADVPEDSVPETSYAAEQQTPPPTPQVQSAKEEPVPPEEPAPPTAEPAPPAGELTATPEFVFTRANMPKLDGSTATVPMAKAVLSALLGESEDEVSDLIHFSKTTQSYYNLMDGERDFLISYECNEEVYAEREARGYEWEMEPFATDAFVFVVNEDNPVDSITIDEARRIYTGEIINWSELGGDDMPITAFQRNRGAGSQTLMEKLVMQGEPMAEAPSGFVVSEMGALIEAVKGYDGSPGAIGYTVYYYADQMRMAQGLKMLRIGGVEPNSDNIRSGAYPLLNPLFVVMSADEPEDSAARALFRWMLSDEGQRIAAEAGYVPVKEVPDARSAPEAAAEPVGSRWYENRIEDLIPRDDYGVLIPFAGQRLTEDWPAYSGVLYGLMTEDGAVVVDPVFAYVSYYGFPDGDGGISRLMVLSRGDMPSGSVAVADAEGRWSTDYVYSTCVPNGNGLVMFSASGMTIMNPGGSIEGFWERGRLGLTDETYEWILGGEMDVGGIWKGDLVMLAMEYDPGTRTNTLRCFDLSAGKPLTMTEEEWLAMTDSEDGDGYSEPKPPVPGNVWAIYDLVYGRDKYIWHRYDGETHYYYADGTPMPDFVQGWREYSDNYYERIGLAGGLFYHIDLDSAVYYDLETMEVVFRTYLGYAAD